MITKNIASAVVSRCYPAACRRRSCHAVHRDCLTPQPSRRVMLLAAQGQQRDQMADRSQPASLGPDPATDPDQPVYHVAPRQGWANDGNGFIYYKGRYHMFYQHIPDSSDWAWRMCWGHATSADLINWEHEPIALRPTPGGPDEKGCWSGCCAVDQHGVPTILYTGVSFRRLGSGPRQQQQHEDAISQPVVEVQCAAVADADDERMLKWTKVEQPVIPGPPPGLRVTGFRDPYVIQTGGKDRDWLLLLGSGIHGEGGALLLYRSQNLSSGWEYVGPLCVGKQMPGEEHDTGAMWECPFFVPLPAQADSGDVSTAVEGEDNIMCVSPYPHINKSPTNTCLYWIGRYAAGKFDLQHAKGPFLLDLGDALYAPNCFKDGQGRRLMLGWFQEQGARGPSSDFTYSGCLTLPRVLSRRGDRLHQAPAPELLGLRHLDNAWRLGSAPVFSAKATLVPHVSGSALNVDVTIDPAESEGTAFSVLLVSDAAEQNGAGFIGTTAVTVDWAASTLKVHQLGHVDKSTYTFDRSDASSSVGGHVQLAAGEPAHLQVFLDHSALEVFLGSGETLCTRVYRRVPPEAAKGAGIAFVAHGGTVQLSSAEAYEMRTIWSAKAGL